MRRPSAPSSGTATEARWPARRPRARISRTIRTVIWRAGTSTHANSYYYWYGDTAVSEVEDYNFGFYDSEAQSYDQILNAAPNYLPVVSSSNDRDDTGPAPGTKHYYWDARYNAWRFSTKTRNGDGGTTGYDCIPFGFQISKNTLTVGAVYDVLSYTGPSSVVLAPFSSTGPCDDGRIKPDVVGNGMELLSSYSTNDSSYAIASGTSMASPNVCGSLGLVADYYRDTHGGTPMWASTLKALAIHTALEAGIEPRSRLPVRLGASQRLCRVQDRQQGLSRRRQGIRRAAHPQPGTDDRDRLPGLCLDSRAQGHDLLERSGRHAPRRPRSTRGRGCS